ncbi:MAG TPA: hypothetical protein VGB71_07035, partial [Flavisolibacter sp.]
IGFSLSSFHFLSSHKKWSKKVKDGANAPPARPGLRTASVVTGWKHTFRQRLSIWLQSSLLSPRKY